MSETEGGVKKEEESAEETLSPAELAAIASADPVNVGFLSNSGSFPEALLLRKSHPQASLDRFRELDYGQHGSLALGEFMAASTIAHATDCWSYFAGGLRAILLGDEMVGQHLLYYAELRAALGILARHGILIRSSNHLIIDALSTIHHSRPLGTHEAVWDYLNAWSRTPAARRFFLSSISMGSVTADTWLAAQGSMPLLTMAEVFQRLGYDLNRFKQDRILRNSVSYGPRLNHTPLDSSYRWFASDVAQYWQMVEPTEVNGFDQVDRILCSQMVVAARRESKLTIQHDKILNPALDLAALVGSSTPKQDAYAIQSVAQFKNDKNPLRFAFYRTQEKLGRFERLQSMIGRAFVLCRFSSAAAIDVVEAAGVASNALDTWLARFGATQGLWNQSVSLQDLYDDIRGDVADLLEAAANSNRYEFLMEARGSLTSITRFELLPLWLRRDFRTGLPDAA